MADFDLAIIGGGINGAGIARDAAGRGLRVLLAEQNDLASGTSSASTKLIHGGLRYLEHGAVRLVREALIEREVLWRMAPHIIRPMRFVLVPQPALRSPLLLRLGLFIYDHVGGRKILPATKTINLDQDAAGLPLKQGYPKAYEYSDCWVDDARLVVLNAIDAAQRGAVIRTRTRCVRAERRDVWHLQLDARGRQEVATARVLINAAGPWVRRFSETALNLPAKGRVRLDKGSHIVVPRMFEHDRAYLLQTQDRRVVFAIPYERDFTLIGTTDLGFSGDPATVAPSAQEIDYLCRAANDYFRSDIGPKDVVWAFAGVRALYDDGAGRPQDVSRDYHLELDERAHEPPLLTIYSGKITTYRRLAEAALARLSHLFTLGPEWTSATPLPGGDFAHDGVGALVARTRQRWPFLSEDHARRLVGAYGTRVERILGEARTLDDLGSRLPGDLTAAELRYLVQFEWAESADDVLWRRSKLGLRFSPQDKVELARLISDMTKAAG
jgi:glycerol-3-phosphate dehydrogenase